MENSLELIEQRIQEAETRYYEAMKNNKDKSALQALHRQVEYLKDLRAEVLNIAGEKSENE